MGLYDPDLSLISLPMQALPQLLKLSYPPSKHIPGKDAIHTHRSAHVYVYIYTGTRKVGAELQQCFMKTLCTASWLLHLPTMTLHKITCTYLLVMSAKQTLCLDRLVERPSLGARVVLS